MRGRIGLSGGRRTKGAGAVNELNVAKPPLAWRPIWIVCTVNFLFWGWLWADVTCNLEPFADRLATFEEVLPVYKFGGQAISPAVEHSMVSLKAMQTIQQPSYSLVARIANRLSGGSWELRWGPGQLGQRYWWLRCWRLSCSGGLLLGWWSGCSGDGRQVGRSEAAGTHQARAFNTSWRTCQNADSQLERSQARSTWFTTKVMAPTWGVE